jgi:hypothetical protein
VEGQDICGVLVRDMPKVWDGRACIQELKNANYHWRQMEWIGWYNEFKVREVVRTSLGGQSGPQYGNTTFDYRRKCVWDFKVHRVGAPWTILNDQEAVDSCTCDYGCLGFVITLGTAEYDDMEGSFKRWHNGMKGTMSSYVQQRIARGAPSRRRKVSFQVTGFVTFIFEGSAALQAGLRDGWLGKFQEGMRNANGSPRRPKYKIHVDRIPSSILIARVAV